MYVFYIFIAVYLLLSYEICKVDYIIMYLDLLDDHCNHEEVVKSLSNAVMVV